jgi:hypothetical protein
MVSHTPGELWAEIKVILGTTDKNITCNNSVFHPLLAGRYIEIGGSLIENI